jgi:GTPase Era involved in 16S rRNA processing
MKKNIFFDYLDERKEILILNEFYEDLKKNKEIKEKNIFLIGDAGNGKSSLFNTLNGNFIQKISNSNTGSFGMTSAIFMNDYKITDCRGFKKDIETFNIELKKIIKDDDIILLVENNINRNNELFDIIQNYSTNRVILVINKFDQIEDSDNVNDLLSYSFPKNLIDIVFVKNKFRTQCSTCKKVIFHSFGIIHNLFN